MDLIRLEGVAATQTWIDDIEYENIGEENLPHIPWSPSIKENLLSAPHSPPKSNPNLAHARTMEKFNTLEVNLKNQRDSYAEFMDNSPEFDKKLMLGVSLKNDMTSALSLIDILKE